MKEEDYDPVEAFDPKVFAGFIKEKLLYLKRVVNGEYASTTVAIAQAQDKIERYQGLLVELTNYQDVMFHQKVAKCQREAYNSQRTNIESLKHRILIEADFKQKIPIGMSPRQANREYYNQQLRNCLGE